MLALLLGMSAVHAASPTDAEIREQITAEIAQRHPTDTPDWWRGLGPQGTQVILSMLQAQDVDILQRARLTLALGYSDDPQATAYLKTQAQESSNEVLRQQSIRAIGLSQGERELDFLEGFLKNPDPQTRYVTADTLKRIPGERAHAALEGYLKQEKVSWISDRIHKEPLKVEKGILPPPPPPALSAGVTQGLVPALVGTWRGYWLAPNSESSSGMRSEAAEWKLELSGSTELKGLLRIKGKSGIRVYMPNAVKGSGVRFEGTLNAQASGTKPKALIIRGELLSEASTNLLLVRAPGVGGTLILRKAQSPSSH